MLVTQSRTLKKNYRLSLYTKAKVTPLNRHNYTVCDSFFMFMLLYSIKPVSVCVCVCVYFTLYYIGRYIVVNIL